MKYMKFGWAAIAAVGMVGCTGSTGSAGTTSVPTPESPSASTKPAGKKVTITMIAKSSNNPVFQSAKVGAEDAAKELSKSTGTEIAIDWQTPPTEDGQVQAQKIADAANRGVDAILLSCSDAEKVNGAIDDAVGKGVAVMTFDSDAPKSKRFAFYGADDTAVGTQVMDELAKLNGGKGTVAILAGNQNAPNLQKRAAAVREAAKKYPGIKISGVVNHIESPNDATAEVKKVMNANPAIDSWAMVGGWPLFAKGLLDLDPAKVKIVSVDALPIELVYIEKGIAPVLLAQPTYLWGHRSVEMIVDKLVNKKDVKGVEKMDLVRVSKENLGDWAVQLKDWGFTDVDPKYIAMSSKKPKTADAKK